jgi:hypothetical protein
MNLSTIPYYWNYASAFSVTSSTVFFSFFLESFLENAETVKNKSIKNHEKIILIFGRVITRFMQFACAISMEQAAFLSCGDTKRGLADRNFVLLAISLLIEVAEAVVKQSDNPTLIYFLHGFKASFGSTYMVVVLVSSLIIIKKIGCFDLLPVVIFSSCAYLIYKTVRLVNKPKTKTIS